MNREQAEEYSQANGQVVSGGWRQAALGVDLGVPQALGLSIEEWITRYFGGHVKLRIAQRREAIAELRAEGRSQKQTAEILGVNQATVSLDEKSSNRTLPASTNDENSSPNPAERARALADYIAAAEQEPDMKAVKLQARFSKWLWQIHRAHLFDPQEIAAIAPDQIADLEQTLRDLEAFTEAFRRTLRDTRMQIIDGGRP